MVLIRQIRWYKSISNPCSKLNLMHVTNLVALVMKTFLWTWNKWQLCVRFCAVCLRCLQLWICELTLTIVECNKSCYTEVKSCYAYVITRLVNVYVCKWARKLIPLMHQYVYVALKRAREQTHKESRICMRTEMGAVVHARKIQKRMF